MFLKTKSQVGLFVSEQMEFKIEYVAFIQKKNNKRMKHSCGMPSEKGQMGDKDVDENVTLR